VADRGVGVAKSVTLSGVHSRFVLVPALALLAACDRPMKPAVTPDRPAAPLHAIVPAPATFERGSGDGFVITPATTITVRGDAAAVAVARQLARVITTAEAKAPVAVEAGADSPREGAIHLSIAPSSSLGDEGYDLTVTAQRVTLTAAQPAGLFYGVQTLRHLLPPIAEYEAARGRKLSIPAVHIADKPRFVWRGAMLDVARHFFTVEDLKRYIDLIAMLKMNRLHLHLSDDQGWRLEIKSWPNLTKHGGSTEVGGGPGGFYTQEQFADVVSYAQARFVTIVPEIDMPSHINAALASYPELNCDGVAPPLYTGIEVGFSAMCVDKDVTYRFIDDVIREIAALTPGPYFHVGGDEVKKLNAQQYTAFIERAQGIVQKHGKQMVGWDEIASVNLLPTSIVQHWRPKTTPKAAAGKGAGFILSPADRIYLDMKYDASTALGLDWAAKIEVRQSYDWDPVTLLEGIPENSVLGVEAPIWSETVANMRDVEFLLFPRIASAAEIGWSPAAARKWDEFRVRLGAQAPRWTALGINFYRSPDVVWSR
jgi:hexosaminidase